MKTLEIITIVFFYVSLFVELFFYNIPSVVATRKILNPELVELNYFSKKNQKYFHWPRYKKTIVFVLPMVFIYILHFFPAYFFYQLIIESSVNNFLPLVYIGVFFVFLGRLVSHYYLIKIKKIKAKSFNGFVKNGIFRFTRNPGLIGLYLSFFGFFCMRPNFVFLICFIIYLLHMHFKIILEEDYLKNEHGENYKNYLKGTKRYL